MPLESIQYLESYDTEDLKKFVLCLDIQGRPFFKILQDLPEETVNSLMSIMDMIVDNTMGGDLNEAYVLKKGIRCYEELYRLFRKDEFLEELAKLARTHGFTLEDDDRIPALTEDGGIIKYFKFLDTKYYTPDFERDQEIYQPRIDTITNHIHSCVADHSPIRIDGVVPQWGEPRTGKYERGLEGLRIKFAFRDRTATKAKTETPPAS
jgi:hypothetical protein